MARNNNELDNRLRVRGLSRNDLSRSELAKALADLKDGTGGFLSSEEMIRRAFRKRNGK